MLRRAAVVSLLAACFAVLPLTAQAQTAFTPGAPGIGDPYVPHEGNGGYRVQHYGIQIRFNPATNRIWATTAIRAQATQNLSRMNFDLVGLTVDSVTVDGAAATTSRAPRELIVTPAKGIPDGHHFTVVVRYHGKPRLLNDPNLGLSGWFNTPDGAIVAGEPEAGMFWFPANEHPSDKATISVTATVPSGLTAVSNGLLASQPTESGGWTTFRWRCQEPMATYLATLAVGKFRRHTSTTASGIPVINYIDPSYPHSVDRALGQGAQMINFFAKRFGPYPFEAAGGIADNYTSYYALENQTRPTYDKATVRWGGLTSTVAHELAHQWFGDSVSVHRWRDIWLNEGFATYAEWMWDAHHGGPTIAQQFARGYAIPAGRPFWKLQVNNPGYIHMFDAPTYERGAMTLQALRQRVGTRDFFTILRDWAASRKNGNGSTAAFRALAVHVSGKPLAGLFHEWLVQPSKPANLHP